VALYRVPGSAAAGASDSDPLATLRRSLAEIYGGMLWVPPSTLNAGRAHEQRRSTDVRVLTYDDERDVDAERRNRLE